MKNVILVGLITLTACTSSRVAGRTVFAQSSQPPIAQSSDGDRVTVAFSDPSKPGLLRVEMMSGGITVMAYNGREVIIESASRVVQTRSVSTTNTAGLRRLDGGATGLRVEEQNNVMTVGTDSFRRAGRVTIQVPTRTNLNLHSMSGGTIEVEGVEGEITIENMNGRVTANNVAGSVNAHSMNGAVVVTMRQVTPGKALSFVSQNGNVDVTLPANFKADAKMRTGHGEIWTDFDIQTKPGPAPVVQDGRSRGGIYRINLNTDIYGTINGGGSDLSVSTFNGSIFIRKAK